VLVAAGLGMHIARRYIYFAIGFSVFVDIINLHFPRAGTPIHLHEPYVSAPDRRYQGCFTNGVILVSTESLSLDPGNRLVLQYAYYDATILRLSLDAFVIVDLSRLSHRSRR